MGKSDSKMELLAPAGGVDQLKAALLFGADAVYLAADRFGMRARASNFSMEALKDAVVSAHSAGVSVHLTCNVLMMQQDLDELPGFLEQVDDARVDALIIGDMGAFSLAKKYAPHCDLHVSTQASVANAEAAKVWQSLGAKRIVCAREMTLADIAKMRDSIDDELEIEAFVHGAQCMAVSGRCLISSYLTARSGNQGNCTQPCRWNYTLEEEKRPGVHFPIEEGDVLSREGFGSFIMNAKDLNMIRHLFDLKQAGVDSVKIEGRNKKAFYVATVVGAYRRALDMMDEGICEVEYSEAMADLEAELLSVSHRPFSTGFYFDDAEQAVDFDGYEQESIHVADVVDCLDRSDSDKLRSIMSGSDDALDCDHVLLLRCRNRFEEDESLEVLAPSQKTADLCVRNMHRIVEPSSGFKDDFSIRTHHVDLERAPIANRSCNLYLIESPIYVQPGSFVRKRAYRRSARHM